MSGVLRDRKMNVKIKGKVYRTVVRPALMYGTETLKKAHEKKLDVTEMRLQSALVITRLVIRRIRV